MCLILPLKNIPIKLLRNRRARHTGEKVMQSLRHDRDGFDLNFSVLLPYFAMDEEK